MSEKKLNEHIQKILYKSLYNGSRLNTINESISLDESKKTEQEASNILSKNGVQNAQDLINKFKQADSSKNQVMLPLMAFAYDPRNNNERDIISTFDDVSELMKMQKISDPPKLVGNDYYVNNKKFEDFLSFSEYVHGLVGMEKGGQEYFSKMEYDFESEEKPIWSENNIKIYDGNDVGKCVKYTMGGLTGKQYGFCIGQPANTMWQSYRDSKASTFYYIVDENQSNNALHMVVFDNTERGVELTDATNNTGNIHKYGGNPDGYIEYLKKLGVPVEELLTHKPKTDDEEKERQKLGNENRDLDWFKDLSTEHKSKYIGRGHILSDEQFEYLYQFIKNDKDTAFKLMHQYLTIGQAIPENQLNLLLGGDEQ